MLGVKNDCEERQKVKTECSRKNDRGENKDQREVTDSYTMELVNYLHVYLVLACNSSCVSAVCISTSRIWRK
jgi:hypothetical protein